MEARWRRLEADDMDRYAAGFLALPDASVAVGRAEGRERVRLELQMSVGAPDPHDRILIDGDPPLDLRIEGGTHGDRATVGAVVNALEVVARGPAGLQTVISLPLFGLSAP